MRTFVSFAGILLLSPIVALAQRTDCGAFFNSAPCIIDTASQSMQGTWVSQLTDSAGNLTLFEVGSFSPDGSYTGGNVNPSHTTHKGVWVRIGDRKFVLTVMFFTHDANGVFNGIVKARIYLTLVEDLKSYDSLAERVVMDTSGKVLQTVSNIKGHAVRMDIEVPQTLAVE